KQRSLQKHQPNPSLPRAPEHDHQHRPVPAAVLVPLQPELESAQNGKPRRHPRAGSERAAAPRPTPKHDGLLIVFRPAFPTDADVRQAMQAVTTTRTVVDETNRRVLRRHLRRTCRHDSFALSSAGATAPTAPPPPPEASPRPLGSTADPPPSPSTHISRSS